MRPHVELLGTRNCPHLGDTGRTLRDVVSRLAPGALITERLVSGIEEARRLGFPGSPTVRVNGQDIEPGLHEPAIACRLYDGGGTPPEWRIEAAVVRALRPRHVLFLCVANSARSQMAEGIGRAFAPSGVAVSSAGSVPTRVRSEAVRALAEIGVDASGQRSKGIDEIGDGVDVVITLCGEEVCPVWLRPAMRLHWGLPDPAAVEGSEAERMDAFRGARDELVLRVGALFGHS
jgi:arsenate reductase